MVLRVERMESVIAPGKVLDAICDFVRGFIDGFLGK
jgi:predicted hydrocarbon binding protein